MSGKVRVIGLVIILFIVSSALLPSMAVGDIGRFCRFHGPVTVDGQNVPHGTVVTVWLEDPYVGPWTTTTYTRWGQSWYLIDIPPDETSTPAKEGGVDGETVYFRVTYDGSTLPAPSSSWKRIGFIYHPLRLITDGAVCIPGDVNGDGMVDSTDLTALERIIAGFDPPTPCADVNQDGNIDSLDITKLEIIIAGGDP